MARRGINRYLGAIFMAVITVPAVVLSLMVVRAISHEEAYIEKQLEGTLLADVTHAASVVSAEVSAIQGELASTAPAGAGSDPSRAFEAWKSSVPLVEVGFLLSAEHEIIWPAPEPEAAGRLEGKGTSFAAEQEDFFSDREEIPVYENIAVAFQDEILEDADAAGSDADQPAGASLAEAAGAGPAPDRVAAGPAEAEAPAVREDTGAKMAASKAPRGGESRKKAAITEFQQSEEVRQRVFDKAERDGQEVLYRNVSPSQLTTGQAVDVAEAEVAAEAEPEPASRPAPPEEMKKEKIDTAAPSGEMGETGEAAAGGPTPSEAGRIRSVFVAQPLRFSEIVADRPSGIIPRTIDGRLRHIYWQRLENGNILGCLIDAGGFRERMVGALANIYSPVRILTVLDESGSPLVIPQGQESRDWTEPFVAVEISELLPRWESAAYLTEADAISSRARATTTVMWLLILILLVSIVAGGALVLRSAFAEVRLARQRTSFVANVSHELKTPLTSIRMYAEMLRDGRQRDSGKQKQYLDIMTAEAERLTRLINNVLDFSRMERGEKRYTVARCDLVTLARDVVESQRARLESGGFEVVFAARSGRLEVVADEEAVKQAVVNLLSNAEKYSPVTRKIEIEVGSAEGLAAISVRDRGTGIPAGEAGNIFREFYRVDDRLTSEVKGAGLGLTIARKIIADHGGDIRYAPREGGGSVFSILLPPADGKREEQ
jgi:signal transduction histidine kinase